MLWSMFHTHSGALNQARCYNSGPARRSNVPDSADLFLVEDGRQVALAWKTYLAVKYASALPTRMDIRLVTTTHDAVHADTCAWDGLAEAIAEELVPLGGNLFYRDHTCLAQGCHGVFPGSNPPEIYRCLIGDGTTAVQCHACACHGCRKAPMNNRSLFCVDHANLIGKCGVRLDDNSGYCNANVHSQGARSCVLPVRSKCFFVICHGNPRGF
jgi:hypothetical protein